QTWRDRRRDSRLCLRLAPVEGTESFAEVLVGNFRRGCGLPVRTQREPQRGHPQVQYRLQPGGNRTAVRAYRVPKHRVLGSNALDRGSLRKPIAEARQVAQG